MLSHGSTALEVHDVGQPFGNLFRRAAFGTVGTPQLFRVPAQHRSKIHSTNPLERLNKEVKRRADVVGIFPNEGAIIRLIGAVLLEANDEWQIQHRYMQTEPMAELMPTLIDATTPQIATVAA